MRRKEYDVVVVGAGTAGSIAAIAAARSGAKTLVVEQYGSIGGILQLGMSLLGASDAEGYKALGGIGGELIDNLESINSGTKISLDPLLGSLVGQDPEITKLMLIEMAKESKVDFLLHSFVAEVRMEGNRVNGILVANKGGLEEIKGKCFVDCTGDADIVARADGQFNFGREDDSLTQPVSAIFRVGGVNLERVFNYIENNPEELNEPEGYSGQAHTIEFLRNTPGVSIVGFKKAITLARANGDYNIPHDILALVTLPNRTELTVNVTRVQGIDGTNPDDITRAEIETQRQTLQVINFLRKYIPGFENSRIISSPYQVGIRETRHIRGSYTLTADDILKGREFNDQIGRGAYPLDVHDVGAGAKVTDTVAGGNSVTLHKISKSYGIPSRCLIPIDLDNVTVGGRSISATHEAAGSIRGQAVCMVTGHAAGSLAALAAINNQKPEEVPIKKLQSLLQSQGAILERNIKIDSKS